MGNNSELRVDMAYFVRKCLSRGKDFTTKDICEACNLSFNKRVDVQRIYGVILSWRKASQTEFASEALLNKHDTAEEAWDAFLKKINRMNIFLLFSTRNEDGTTTYYQPSWVDKEMLDFVRMRRQLSGHLTVLWEMDLYGEDFPAEEGVLLSPKELAIEMSETLGKAQLRLDSVIENKIKELESSGDDDE